MALIPDDDEDTNGIQSAVALEGTCADSGGDGTDRRDSWLRMVATVQCMPKKF